MDTYYNPEDLAKFGTIGEKAPELAEKFFSYYNAVFEEGALTAREKSLIALAVAHTVQCPYCIDRKHDSQDICFVPDGDYARFMEGFTGKHYPAGDFLDESGKVVGTHNGAVRYTLGQRKGLGLALGAPVYVCGKDMQANTVTVGPESALFDRIVYAEDVNWIAIPELKEPLRVTARTRYHQTEQAATVYPAENGFRLEFDQPQRAPTPGQSVVLYQGDVVLGGGIITRVEK